MSSRRPKDGPRGLFVTGTDTGVGKTVVSAGIVAAMRRQGIDAVPMKAVQTGCRAGSRGLEAPDLRLSLRMSGLAPEPGELARMCPLRFRTACSPHLAARLEGGRISVPAIRRSFDWLAERHDMVVVEGAGGVLVPLGPAGSMLTLMHALALPVVVVARPGLGTLNHTLLTLNEIRRAGLRVAGIVVNQSKPGSWGGVEADNVRTLERLGRVRVIAVIRHRRALSASVSAFNARVSRRLAAVSWARLVKGPARGRADG